jgi:hypothetical protein
MEEDGCDTSIIKDFVKTLDYEAIPEVTKNFVKYNLNICSNGSDLCVISNFLYGREHLIPSVFSAIVSSIKSKFNCKKFVYYLERHIHLDANEHAPLAEKVISYIINNDANKKCLVLESALKSIKYRKRLLDSIYMLINEKRSFYKEESGANASSKLKNFSDLLDFIDDKRIEMFSLSPFFAKISENSICWEQKLSFVPYMLFFSMGFADVVSFCMKYDKHENQLSILEKNKMYGTNDNFCSQQILFSDIFAKNGLRLNISILLSSIKSNKSEKFFNFELALAPDSSL